MKSQSPENSGGTISQQSCKEPERSGTRCSQQDPSLKWDGSMLNLKTMNLEIPVHNSDLQKKPAVIKFKITELRFTFIIASLLVTSTIIAQKSVKMTELDTQRTLRKLIEKSNDQEEIDPELKNSLSSLSKTVTQLFNNIKADKSLQVDSDTLFFQSLEYAQKTLGELQTNWISNEHAKDVIEAIQKDYDIKMSASALGANSKFLSEIQVSVFTRKDDINVNGFDVKCNYLWEYKRDVARFVFNNQTNDATRYLSPGYYVIWIEKDGKVIQKKDKVEIGNLQKQEESILFNL
jgi:hypothetical protein